jgi:O-antigen ligase
MTNRINSRNWSRILIILLPASLLLPRRINVFVIIGYVVAVLWQPRLKERFMGALRRPWVGLFVGLFLIHLLSLGWTEDLKLGWFIMEKKASLLVLPLIIAMDRQLDRQTIHRAMLAFAIMGVLTLVVCLAFAAWQFAGTGNSAVFYYHQLGRPFDLNAVYFSLYLLAGLIFITYLALHAKDFRWLRRPAVLFPLIFPMVVGLILLSSKLFITLFLLSALGYLLSQSRNIGFLSPVRLTGFMGGLALVVAGIFLLRFPRERFEALLDSQFEVVGQEQYRWDTPFSGLTLRLVFLKFGWEILQRNDAHWLGVGAGDARQAMNETMERHQLYLGNPNLGDTGYLNYNFHNQYMELWVQAGLPAFLIFLGLLVQGLWSGWQLGGQFPWLYLVLILAVFALTEGYLERQRGIVFFTFFFSIIQVLIHDEIT